MKKAIIGALVICSAAANSDQLSDLVNTSNAIVDKIDRGIMLVGAATEYGYTGSGMSDGTLSQSAHISAAQVAAYNNALSNFDSYLPYGNVEAVLQQAAATELELMEDSVEVFTTAVVEMSTVIQVAEMAEESVGNPAEEEQVQEFVAQNEEVLMISQDTVESYNDSMDSIEEHANKAAGYIAVAANEDAVAFLEQGAINNNSVAEEATLTYSAEQQWVSMQWAGTNNATAVYLSGQNFGLDMYVDEASVLYAGAESEFYLTGPTANGYDCFMYGTGCDYESSGN